MITDGSEYMTSTFGISGSENVDGKLALLNIGGFELFSDELQSRLVFLRTSVMRETAGEGNFLNLWFEEIGLVQEENDGRILEPMRVEDFREEAEGFQHADDTLIFFETLIVLGEWGKKENSGDSFETMDPLPAFRSLTADVNNLPDDSFVLKVRFGNTRGFLTGIKDVLIGRNISVTTDSIDRVHKVLQGFRDLKLSDAFPGSLDIRIIPKRVQQRGQIGGQRCGLEVG